MLQAYVRPLSMVLFFKYLGRVLTADIENWVEVIWNLRKVQKRWA